MRKKFVVSVLCAFLGVAFLFGCKPSGDRVNETNGGGKASVEQSKPSEEIISESLQSLESAAKSFVSGAESESSAPEESPKEEEKAPEEESSGESVKENEQIEIGDAVSGFCTTSYLNIRKGPSTDTEKVGHLSFNEEIIGNSVVGKDWIKLSDGRGYVSSDYFSTEKTVVQLKWAIQYGPNLEHTLHLGRFHNSIRPLAPVQATVDSGQIAVTFSAPGHGFCVLYGHNPGIFSGMASVIYEGMPLRVFDNDGASRDYVARSVRELDYYANEIPDDIWDEQQARPDILCLQYCQPPVVMYWKFSPVN